jgi:cytochrome c biogenesis protein CcmG/thiol:disulfide interchange protein DsbE
MITTFVALGAAVLTYRLLDDDDDSGLAADEPASDLAEIDLSELSFQELDGTTVRLSELRGSPLVINFFASWCTPCRSEMPALQAVADDLGDEVTFLGLAEQDRPEDTRDFVDDLGVTYMIGRDVDSAVGVETGAILRLPGTLLVDADGTVVARHIGELDEAELRTLLRDELGIEA